MNHQVWYCEQCDDIYVTQYSTRHGGIIHFPNHGATHHYKWIDSYPSEMSEYEVRADVRHRIDTFGIGRKEVVAHG